MIQINGRGITAEYIAGASESNVIMLKETRFKQVYLVYMTHGYSAVNR